MGEDNINVVELEVLQALQGSLDDVLPRQSTGVVGLLSVGTEEDLGGDDVVSSILSSSEGVAWRRREGSVTHPSGLLQNSTHLLLGLDDQHYAPFDCCSWRRLTSPALYPSAVCLLLASGPHDSVHLGTHVKHVDTCTISAALHCSGAQ